MAAEDGVAGGAYSANIGGLAGTTGILTVNESGQREVDGKNVALTMLKTGAAVASGAATFSASAGPAGGVAAAVLGAVGDAIGGGIQAYDAQKCYAALEDSYKDALALPRTNTPIDSNQDIDDLIACLEGCLAKSRIKFRAGVGKATIVGQPGVALYRTGKAAYKFFSGTKGKGRRDRAETLIRLSKKERGWVGFHARRAIKAIVGMEFEKVMTHAVSEAMKS